MIRELVPKYYLEQNNNCAEALLRAADEALSLGLPPESFRLGAGFGGGFGCGRTCGAVCSAVAVLSHLMVGPCAHETPGFRKACADCVAALREKLGAVECREIAPRLKSRETRCLTTVELAADALEAALKQQGLL